MRSSGSDKALALALLLVLTVSSVGLKASVGTAKDGGRDVRTGQLEEQLIGSLRAQGFETKLHPQKLQSSIIYAKRGGCRLSVRDAREGDSVAPLFARQARDIGPLRFVYRGQSYSSPPAFRMRLDRFKNELLYRLGAQGSTAVPLAIATSTECNGQNFGLENTHISI